MVCQSQVVKRGVDMLGNLVDAPLTSYDYRVIVKAHDSNMLPTSGFGNGHSCHYIIGP